MNNLRIIAIACAALIVCLASASARADFTSPVPAYRADMPADQRVAPPSADSRTMRLASDRRAYWNQYRGSQSGQYYRSRRNYGAQQNYGERGFYGRGSYGNQQYGGWGGYGYNCYGGS